MKSALASFSILLLITLFIPLQTSAQTFNYDVIKSKVAHSEVLTPAEQAFWQQLYPQRNQEYRPQLPQRDDRGGPDDFGYRWIDSDEEGGPEFEWIDITEVGRGLAMDDDDNQGPFPIGFEFPFYDQVMEEFNIGSNGYIVFGSDFQDYSHWEYQFPLQGEPFNIIAPLWLDLNPLDQGETIFYWTNEDENLLVVQWNEVPTFDWGERYDELGPKTFQVQLHRSGAIIFQYLDENGPHEQGLIGMQNGDGSIGFQIANDQAWEHPELACRIQAAAGWVTGFVLDLANDEPLAGVQLELSDGTETETDDEGLFWFNEVGDGMFSILATLDGYNVVESEEFEIVDQETTEVDLALPHPEIEVDTDGFFAELPQQGVEESAFHIINNGNGELEYNMYYAIPMGDERDDPGDLMFEWDASGLTEDNRLRGLTVMGQHVYLSGSNNSDNPNFMYVLNFRGELVNQFEQPIEEPTRNGFRGLTNDGTYLYTAEAEIIYQLTTDGEITGTIISPIRTTYNIAYDEDSDHFWVSSATGDIIEIDREGNVVTELDNDFRIYGLDYHAADPDGYFLYVFHQLPDGSSAQLTKVNPETGEFLDVLDLTINEGDESNDVCLTDAFNPLIWMVVGLMENGAPDFIRGVELELNTSWVEIEPLGGTIDPESETEISVRFDAGQWLPGLYQLVLAIESNAAGNDVIIPLTMNVTNEGLARQYFEFDLTDWRHNFVITSLDITGAPAEFGDEIGLFTTEGLCAGGSIWFGQVTTVPAYGDNPDTDFTEGFVEGEAIIFRVWDEDADREFAPVYDHAQGPETFTNEGVSRGSLSVPDLQRALEIELVMGWNLISANVIPENNDIRALFTGLVEDDLLEMVKDGTGRFYNVAFNFNNIPAWVETEGYQVKTRRAGIFVVSGERMDPATPIELQAGWNMIAYLPTWEIDAIVGFEPLGENLEIAKDGDGNFYAPAWGFSNMGNLRETRGYQAKVQEAVEFSYPQQGGGFIPAADIRPQSSHFGAIQPTNQSMSLLIQTENLRPGSELAVVSENDSLYGTTVVTSGWTGLAAWGDDPTTPEVDGFRAGDQILVKVWERTAGELSPGVRILTGSDKFEGDSFTVLEISTESATEPMELKLNRTFPNPFNSQTTVSFDVPQTSLIDLSLYDTQGRLMSVLTHAVWQAGQHQLTLNQGQIPTGTYLLRLSNGQTVRTQKLVMLK